MNLSIALALIVIGIVMLIFGFGATDSIQNTFSRLFSGHPTDKTMWLIIGGCVCVVLGIVGGFRQRIA